MTEEQQKEFEILARPLIRWLNDNCNPHSLITIDVDSATLLSGELAIHTKDYIKD